MRIQVVWGVAMFALIGSGVVALAAFRDGPAPRDEAPPPLEG